MTFPNDDTGEALRRLAAQGDDLSQPRDIHFTVVFRDEPSAMKFAERLRGIGHESTTEETNTVVELPWDVLVTQWMVPDHQAITDFEIVLKSHALDLGGRNDGWGCFTGDGSTSG